MKCSTTNFNRLYKSITLCSTHKSIPINDWNNALLSNLIKDITDSGYVQALLTGSSFTPQTRTQALLNTMKQYEFSDDSILIVRNFIDSSQEQLLSTKEIPDLTLSLSDHNTTINDPGTTGLTVFDNIENLIVPDQPSFSKKRKQPFQEARLHKSAKVTTESSDNDMKTILLLVKNPYKHFECNTDCSICGQVFKSIDLTPCKKMHGGPQCNELGLYPHASKTYLTIVHVTKKIVNVRKGLSNPLSNEPFDRNLKIPQHANVMKMSSTSKMNPADKLSRYQYNYDDIATEQEVKRRKLTQNWRLQFDSSKESFDNAMKMFNIWKKAGTAKPPSWATVASKILFDSGDVRLAREKSLSVSQKKHLKRENRRRTIFQKVLAETFGRHT